MRKFLQYLICLPNDIWAVPLVLLIHFLWGSNLRIENMSICTSLRKNSWPKRTWYKKWSGTVFGHAIMYGPNPSKKTKSHEHTHERQYLAAMAKSLGIGLLVLLVTAKIWLFCTIWATGWFTYVAANWFIAWLRGANWYRDSIHEEHAYAIGELCENDTYQTSTKEA